MPISDFVTLTKKNPENLIVSSRASLSIIVGAVFCSQCFIDEVVDVDSFVNFKTVQYLSLSLCQIKLENVSLPSFKETFANKLF